MRVLFLCHRIPYPPDKGDKIRAFHELRGIAARHEVDLFTLADDPADFVHRSALLRFCHSVTVATMRPGLARLKSLPWFFTRTPLTLPYFHSRKLEKAIRSAVLDRCYDRIFVYSSAMAQYVNWTSAPPVVTDLVDVDSDKWRQYATFVKFPYSAIYRREERTLREFELEVCCRSSGVAVTTEREAGLVREVSSDARVHVIPNGVDFAHFSPAPDAPGTSTVSFVGDMSYFPNEEAASFFARSVFPSIRKQVADARFLIVGRNPTSRVRELSKVPGVEVTGSVPDVRPFLAQAQVSVAPFSISAGIPNKILEAMSCGVPVVATTRAVQGLTRDVAEAVELADGAGEFAARVMELLKNPASARRRGLAGRERVMAAHNWDRSLEVLLNLLENPQPQGLRDMNVQCTPV